MQFQGFFATSFKVAPRFSTGMRISTSFKMRKMWIQRIAKSTLGLRKSSLFQLGIYIDNKRSVVFKISLWSQDTGVEVEAHLEFAPTSGAGHIHFRTFSRTVSKSKMPTGFTSTLLLRQSSLFDSGELQQSSG